MMIVVGLIALLAGITFPAFSSGVDSLRLTQATRGAVDFFNEALNRVERRSQAVEIGIDRTHNRLVMHSAGAGFEKVYELPAGVSIFRILPEVELVEEGSRQFFLYPGGAVPQAGIEMVNARNTHRIVRLDPITGVPKVELAENR